MIRFVCGAVLAMAGVSASAATITYNVSQTIGSGSVFGTIQTNGALGVLAASDITGFDLTVSAPGVSVMLTQADSILRNEGNNLSATATDLFFNYDGAAGYLLFQQGSFGTGARYFCNASTSADCFQGASAVPEFFNSASAQYEGRSGLQSIASVAGAVPEPASWSLMIGGFAATGLVVRRRRQLARCAA